MRRKINNDILIGVIQYPDTIVVYGHNKTNDGIYIVKDNAEILNSNINAIELGKVILKIQNEKVEIIPNPWIDKTKDSNKYLNNWLTSINKKSYKESMKNAKQVQIFFLITNMN
jgi:hypothetical protein